ncbi:MAG: NAD(P)H-dependent oxidoreductase [Bacteroidia bacterium]|nr:NAD(P)H-dependent oxidoreductase [Bacteroidia bacterium]
MIDNQYITIISGSPRTDSNTRKVTNTYGRLARERNLQVKVFDLLSLPPETLFHNQVMGLGNRQLDEWVDEYIVPASTLVFIFPEYNGSFPGLLKSFIDGVNPDLFRGKKVAMVGVATGRAGNLRGMDHLQMVMHHLGAWVLPLNLPISRVHTLSDENEITDPSTLNALHLHIEKLLQY